MLGTSPAPRGRPACEGLAQTPWKAASKTTEEGEKSVWRRKCGVRRAPLAVHAGVLPLDGERPVVADAVQDAEERLEVDVAVAGRDEGPAAVGLAEVDVRAEDRARPSSMTCESLTWTW